MDNLTKGMSTIKFVRAQKDKLAAELMAAIFTFENSSDLKVKKVKLIREDGLLRVKLKVEME